MPNFKCEAAIALKIIKRDKKLVGFNIESLVKNIKKQTHKY